jgi:NRPS condensation-like uncharacterized protein
VTAPRDTAGAELSWPFTAIEELDHYLDNTGEPSLVQLEIHAPGHLDAAVLAAALGQVLAADPAARRRLAPTSRWGRRLYWRTAAPDGADELLTTSRWDSQDQLAALRERLSAWPMSLHDTAVRVILAPGPEHDVVLVQAHHSAFDGVAALAFLTALSAAYRNRTGRGAIADRLPPLSPAPPGPLAAPKQRDCAVAVAVTTATAQSRRSQGHSPPRTADVPGPAQPPRTGDGPRPTDAPRPEDILRPAGSGRPDDPPRPAVRPREPAGAAGPRRAGDRPGAGRRPGADRLPGTVTRIAARAGAPGRPGYGFVLRSAAVARPARHGRGPHPTVNDLLVAALILAIDRWNAALGQRGGQIRITVPVNDRDPAQRWAGAGNRSRLIRVTAGPGQRADPAALLRHVAAQTRAGKERGRSGLDATSRLLGAGWAPALLKRPVARAARRVARPAFVDTSLVSNLGVLPDPPSFGGGREPVWLSGPAPMPRGLAVGALTIDGQLHLCVHYRHALLDRAAAEDFTDAYARALADLATATAPARAAGPAGKADPAQPAPAPVPPQAETAQAAELAETAAPIPGAPR